MEANTKIQNSLKVHTKEEIDANPGKYDDDGFYLLDDGGFYDDHGYYFNSNGFNQIGGFYDPDSGEYICPEDFDPDYIEGLKVYFTELGAESDEEASD